MIGSRRGKGLLVIPDNWERERGREERREEKEREKKREREKRLLKPYSLMQ